MSDIVTTTRWLPVELLDDGTLIAAAAARARVRLDSGAIWQLVRWPSQRTTSSNRKARVVSPYGVGLTVRCSMIVEVEATTC